jgi:hypothetical protein
MVDRGRVTKCLVRGSLCSLAAIVGAQIYAVRELLAILLMLWLSFLVLWISLSTFIVLCEMSRRGLNWLASTRNAYSNSPAASDGASGRSNGFWSRC